MQSGKTDSFGNQELMTCMLKIMLIICIIYNTLKIALIIPYRKFKAEIEVCFLSYYIIYGYLIKK